MSDFGWGAIAAIFIVSGFFLLCSLGTISDSNLQIEKQKTEQLKIQLEMNKK